MGVEVDVRKATRYPPEAFVSALPVDLVAGENKVAEYVAFAPRILVFQGFSFSRLDGLSFYADVDGFSKAVNLENLGSVKGLEYEEDLKFPATRSCTLKLYAPTAILILSLNLFNFFFAIYLSFSEWKWYEQGSLLKWVGLKHYISLSQDPIFYLALKNTFIWSAATVGSSFLIGLMIALLLNAEIRGIRVLRTLMLFPYAVPILVASTAFHWLLNPHYGLINEFLLTLGVINKPILWLQLPETAFPSVISVQIWRDLPFATIVLLSGLQTISVELYDAAEVDGASSWQKFRHITFPLLTPISSTLLLLLIIDSFKKFVIIYTLTLGGPMHTTEVLTTYSYYYAFSVGDVGRGSAISTIAVLVPLVFGILWVKKILEQEV